MNKRYMILLLVIAALGALAVLWNPKQASHQQEDIASFEECAAAGYPVMESYPRQCSTPDGRLFVETVVPEQ